MFPLSGSTVASASVPWPISTLHTSAPVAPSNALTSPERPPLTTSIPPVSTSSAGEFQQELTLAAARQVSCRALPSSVSAPISSHQPWQKIRPSGATFGDQAPSRVALASLPLCQDRKSVV